MGINDHFFELGGHSLKATQLVSKAHKELNMEIPLSEMFNSPTIKGISRFLESVEQADYVEIKPAAKKDVYKASSAQKRMYLLQQFDPKNTGYNMPVILEAEGLIDVERVQEVLNQLIVKHESLRTSFGTEGEEIVQRIHEEVSLNLDLIDMSKLDSSEDKINEKIKSFIEPFDLSLAPLIRVKILKLEHSRHLIMFDIHHAISDGLSMNILVQEFMHLYGGGALSELKVQYKDYTEWQNELFHTESMRKQEKYWLEQFSQEVPTLNLYTDYTRPSIQSFEGKRIGYKIDKTLTQQLKQLARKTNTTMYMVLLSGINILLSKYSDQEDIIIGTPVAGRTHVDLHPIIGMFVNTLAMRNRPVANKVYADFLQEIKENALKAYENEGYPFEELVNQLNLRRDTSRNPLFDVMFTMDNIENTEIQIN
ncbi:condensation domain-containing protein, partial [Lysinibacillus xylanilyticus]|uniref:condensation domain-containing protein n=1 Tax=Lysinibacillus xylanilyticus TaxID=582475 RepID=UPI00382D7FB0